MRNRMVIAAMLLAAMVAAVDVASAAEPKLDLSAWQHLPVLHHGRVMPLDTFARTSTEIICKRENPKLSLAGLTPAELKSPEFAGALELFPNGAERKFTAPEILLSWLVEPERWEHVPFLIAEHDELRKLLGVPTTDAAGAHLGFVSPATVAESTALRQQLEDTFEAQRAAKANNEEYRLSAVEAKARKLFEAFTLYRHITFHPVKHEGVRAGFLQQARDVLGSWQKVEPELSLLAAMPGQAETVMKTGTALETMAEAAQDGRFELNKVEPSVVIAVTGLQVLAVQSELLRARMFEAKEGKAPGLSADQLKVFQRQAARVSAALRLLARQANEMHIAMYDDGDALRVVPAMNPAALDKDRDTTDESQPWATLQTVLYGSPEMLSGYPQSQVSAVRATWGRLAAAFVDRKSTRRAESVKNADVDFAAALRKLGEQTSVLREKLDLAGRDSELMKYTAYPPLGATDTEVRYHQLDPFMLSWMISFIALACFALSIGVIRKPMFWLGMVVLLGGLLWTAYGFALRVMITQWAPVTNMYETVVYVPFFVSALGAWFALVPVLWPGLHRAWRLAAIPRTWEAGGEDDAPDMAPTWLSLGVIVARVALMAVVFQVLTIKPYAAGGRTIVSLMPVVDEGASLPNLNNLVVWLVGMCVMLPTVWYLPRAIVTVALGLFTVPQSLRREGRQVTEQVYERKFFGMAATFAALLGAFVAWYSPSDVLDKNFSPLQPVLRDNFWLTIHVLTIVSSYGAGALAWGLGNLSLGYFLFGRYRNPTPHSIPVNLPAGMRPAKREADEPAVMSVETRLPPFECHTLSGFIYKTFQVAVLLLAAGTILGGLWADVSWGRFWGWDPKEVWALISLLTYLAILHGRYVGWFGDFGLATGSVLGATAIVMSWYGVNFVLGVGLHAYGFGTGGQYEVASCVLLNWLFLGAAGARYYFETRTAGPADHQLDASAQEPAAVDHEVGV